MAEERSEHLRAGDAAPAFALRDQHGGTVRLEDYRGRKLLVYFFPEADTPGCTKQSCDLRDHRVGLTELGVGVVGISPDEPSVNERFDQKYGLGFPLLSDPDHAVTRAWGAWGEKRSYGRGYVGLLRSSFLVDVDGRLSHVWYRVKAPDTAPRALEALGASASS